MTSLYFTEQPSRLSSEADAAERRQNSTLVTGDSADESQRRSRGRREGAVPGLDSEAERIYRQIIKRQGLSGRRGPGRVQW